MRVSFSRQGFVYGAAWSATTVVLTIFSHRRFGLFVVGSVALGLAHVVDFNRAVREWDPSKHQEIREWMIVACFVTSSVFAAGLLHGLSYIPKMSHWPFTPLEIGLAQFTIFFGFLGYGIPGVKMIYLKGLELYKADVWKEMRAYMEQDGGSKRLIHSFPQKCQFLLAITAPEKFENLLSFPVKISTRMFFSTDHLVKYLKDLLDSPRSATLLDLSLHFLKELPSHLQWELIPRYLEIGRTVNIERRLPMQGEIAGKRQLLSENQNRLLRKCQLSLFESWNQRLDEQKVQEVSGEIHELRNEISLHCKETEIFLPRLILTELRQFQKRLLTGFVAYKLQRLNSQTLSRQKIDRMGPTSDFIIVQFSQDKKYQHFLDLFNVADPNTFDQALDKLGIGTLGDFIGKVLNNDESLLYKEAAVLRLLKEFLSSRTRNRLYTLLTGTTTHPVSKVAPLVDRATYITIMIISTAAPLQKYPYQTAVGTIGGFVYYSRPAIQRRFSAAAPYIRSYQSYLDIAMRRPFLRLFFGRSFEVSSYQNADTWGKMRILALECFHAFLISNLDVRGIPIGGLIQGAALGREIYQLV